MSITSFQRNSKKASRNKEIQMPIFECHKLQPPIWHEALQQLHNIVVSKLKDLSPIIV